MMFKFLIPNIKLFLQAQPGAKSKPAVLEGQTVMEWIAQPSSHVPSCVVWLRVIFNLRNGYISFLWSPLHHPPPPKTPFP